MTIHFLREIDATGLFVGDHPFWDDGAKAAIPAVLAEDGTVTTPAVAAVPATPIPANMIDIAVPEGFGHPKWNGTAWVEGQDPAVLLAQAQVKQIATLAAAYNAAITAAVSYTSKAGVVKTYQSDPQSVANLQAAIAGCSETQAAPTGFYWVAADNTQVPFAFADLMGLAAAMFGQGAVAFQKLQTLKASVLAATTPAAVSSVVW